MDIRSAAYASKVVEDGITIIRLLFTGSLSICIVAKSAFLFSEERVRDTGMGDLLGMRV